MASVVGTRFTNVTTSTDCDKTMDLTFAANKNTIYESQMIASIFDDGSSFLQSLETNDSSVVSVEENEGCTESAIRNDNHEKEQKKMMVLSDLNDDSDLLVVTIGEDVSVFSFDCGIRFIITMHLGDNINPVAVKFMPVVNLLMVVEDSGNLIFLCIDSKRVIHQLNLMENKLIESASISWDFQLEDACMCIALDSGKIYLFTFPNYTNYFHHEEEIELAMSNRQKDLKLIEWHVSIFEF
ncbi:unnamed protein product [Thelazia callipaeda]|uniref:CNH domain-containing protein n=1 Tax=Thelazia callipaeda TaxID=103827 RepID=A0A0N5D241_THECL|nr:unnamed protein product [Thelazia callipaeda]